MNELVLGAIFLVIGFGIGYIYREITLIRYVAKMTMEMSDREKARPREQTDQLEISDIKKLKHEVINNVNYFYCEESGTFMGQGESFDQAAVQCSKTLGNHVIGIFSSAEDKQNYCFVDGKCCEYVDD